MATTQGEASAGSETLQVGPPRTTLQIVMGLVARGLIQEPDMLRNVWSAVEDADPDKCLKGLLVGGTFVVATSLIGMAMRKLWTWLTINNISTGSVIYHVSVPTTRVVELQRLVDSGEMKKSLNEILHKPKEFLEDLFLKKDEIDKALRVLPKDLTISSLERREEHEVKNVTEGKSSSRSTDPVGPAVPLIKNLTAKRDAYVKGRGNYFDKRVGDAASLPQLELPKSLSTPNEKDDGETGTLVENMTVDGETYVEQSGAVFDHRKTGSSTILVRVIGRGLTETFKRDFQRTDLVFDVLGALKKETGKEYRVQIKKTKKTLEEEDSLDDAGVTNGMVLEAIEI